MSPKMAQGIAIQAAKEELSNASATHPDYLYRVAWGHSAAHHWVIRAITIAYERGLDAGKTPVVPQAGEKPKDVSLNELTAQIGRALSGGPRLVPEDREALNVKVGFLPTGLRGTVKAVMNQETPATTEDLTKVSRAFTESEKEVLASTTPQDVEKHLQEGLRLIDQTRQARERAEQSPVRVTVTNGKPCATRDTRSTETLRIPHAGEAWQHGKTGRVAIVTHLTNTEGSDQSKWPITVVYQCNGHLWSRELSEFMDRFRFYGLVAG